MIYFVRNTNRKAIKIGYSEDVFSRLNGLQTSSPDRLKLLGVCPGGVPEEKALHQRLAHLHLRGEWFRDCAEVLAVLKEVCAGHRQHGRCPKCGAANTPLHENLDQFVCDDCDAPGVPATLRRAHQAVECLRKIPAGGGYRIIRKKVP